MFTGVSYKAAIDYWKKGREVIVIDRNSQNDSGGYDNFPFEELFRNVEFLADVPAVENPEFRQAVEDMIHGSDQNTMDEDKNGISAQAAKIAKELKDSVEGEVLPPPSRGRRRKSLRPENQKRK